jgi:SOS-response transcriptional repressor LexA
MEEQTTTIRPTKKQHDLLEFIDGFIKTNGYSPSYREIMQALDYTSVATVALHVNSLISRGHLKKRDRSARSLEVIKPIYSDDKKVVPKQLKVAEGKWLVEKVEVFFKEAESTPKLAEREIDQLYVLIGALKVLGLDGAATSFIARLTELKKKTTNEYNA